MNISAVLGFKASLRKCGIEILSNAGFIETEIQKLSVSAELRAEVMDVCNHIRWLGYEVMGECHDYDDRVDEGSDPARLVLIADRILSGIEDDMARLHKLVTKLESLADPDPACGSAYVLVAESAANIMIPINRAREAVAHIPD